LNIIERTFEVFSGPEGTMDRTGFVKFCESSKKVPASDADTIFLTVVQNVRNGMHLGEFEAALELCVNSGKGERIGADRKCLNECPDVCPDVLALVFRARQEENRARRTSARATAST